MWSMLEIAERNVELRPSLVPERKFTGLVSLPSSQPRGRVEKIFEDESKDDVLTRCCCELMKTTTPKGYPPSRCPYAEYATIWFRETTKAEAA